MNRKGIGGKKGQKKTTGKECDGCGASPQKFRLRVVVRYDEAAGTTLRLTFCLRCDRLDQETHGLVPRRDPPPPRLPPAPPRAPLAIGWTTSPILPRLRAAGSFSG